MIENPRISRALRYLTYAVLAGLVLFGVYAVFNRTPDLSQLSDADIGATVAAEVAGRLEGTATRAVTPDVTASIEARLTQVALGTPLPTAAASTTPTPAPALIDTSAGGVGGVIGGIVNAVWGLLSGLWNFFSFGGIVIQSLCCIFVPLLVLIGLLRERPL